MPMNTLRSVTRPNLSEMRGQNYTKKIMERVFSQKNFKYKGPDWVQVCWVLDIARK